MKAISRRRFFKILVGIFLLSLGVVLGALFSLLHDRDDAKHIYQAYRSGVNYFITVDRRSILNKYDEIYSICKVKVYAPSEFINNRS